MIGKIYSSIVPFYDMKSGKNSFKSRPVLILSGPRNNDYTVLPISSVTKKQNLDLEYDIELNPQIYPNLNLQKICYVRVHKQTTVHTASLNRKISNLKDEYEDLYLSILSKLEEYNKFILKNAL